MKYYLLNCTFPHREQYKCEDITSKGVYGLTHQMMLTGKEAQILDKLQSNGNLSNEKWNLDIISVEKISQQDHERFSKVIHGPCSALIKESIWAYIETSGTDEGFYGDSEECYLIDLYYNSVNHQAKQYWFQMMADEQEAELLMSRFGELISSPEFKLNGGDSKDLEGVVYTGICEVSREDYDRLNNWLGRYEEKCCKEILKVIRKCLEKGNKAVDEGKRQWEEPIRFGSEKKSNGNELMKERDNGRSLSDLEVKKSQMGMG